MLSNLAATSHRRAPARIAFTAVLLGALGACSEGTSPSPDSTPHATTRPAPLGTPTSTASAPAPSDTATPEAAPDVGRARYAAVMVEIGQRFELLGRATLANRHELAAYEVDQLADLFDEDLRAAALPKKGATRALPGMADSFRGMHIPALARATKARDKKAFNEAFTAAAAACNGCHDSSGHRFIEIGSVPGKPMLVLDPLPATR